MRPKRWGAGALLYRISMIGVTKVLGRFSGDTEIALLFPFGIVALVNLFSIPVTLFLGIARLIISGTEPPFALFSGPPCAW
jgi:hypothetical protein